MVLSGFEIVPHMDWAVIIVTAYMGARTVDKLGQLISAASVAKAALTGKK
jgi:hypothetical protein